MTAYGNDGSAEDDGDGARVSASVLTGVESDLRGDEAPSSAPLAERTEAEAAASSAG
jgi:hypothetical protein